MNRLSRSPFIFAWGIVAALPLFQGCTAGSKSLPAVSASSSPSPSSSSTTSFTNIFDMPQSSGSDIGNGGVEIPPQTDSSTSVLIIQQVLPSRTSPTAQIEILSNTLGEMGKFCGYSTLTGLPRTQTTSTTLDDGTVIEDTDAASEAACRCEFSYPILKEAATPQQSQWCPDHSEDNLLRCSMPETLLEQIRKRPNMPVIVRVQDSQAHYSNELIYHPNIVPGLDIRDPNLFARVKRHQCRQVISVPHQLDVAYGQPFANGSIPGDMMYDPFLSDAYQMINGVKTPNNLIFPVNFYSSNVADSMARYLNLVGSDQIRNLWDCPTETMDAALGFGVPVYSFNANTFSADGQDGRAPGSFTISPAMPGEFNRDNFYLAKNPVGVFEVPLNTYVAPEVRTTTSSEGDNAVLPPPIGYGAKAIVSNNLFSTTTNCPNIGIPEGFQWVKVWQFRRNINPIKAPRSTMLNSFIDGSSPLELYCNPGRYKNDANGKFVPNFDDRESIVQGCLSGIGYDNLTNSLSFLSSSDAKLVDRVLRVSNGFQYCAKLADNAANNTENDPLTSVYCKKDAQGNLTGPGPGCTGENSQNLSNSIGKDGLFGTDLFKTLYKFAGKDECKDSSGFGFNACKEDSRLFSVVETENDASKNSAKWTVHPQSAEIIYVVTPMGVQKSDLENFTDKGRQFIPWRFLHREDCDPSNPNPEICAASLPEKKRLNDYGVYLQDATMLEIQGNQGTPLVYPLCALQKVGEL